ncbi:MAG: hypothetical protein LBR89_03495 [Holosporales bacterium]|nr:hypothetical protein [Holosporales bacterium]
MNDLLKTLKVVVRLCPLFLVTLPTQATTADDVEAPRIMTTPPTEEAREKRPDHADATGNAEAAPSEKIDWDAVLKAPDTSFTDLGEVPASLDGDMCVTNMVDVLFLKDGTPTSRRLAKVYIDGCDQVHECLQEIAPYKRLAADPSSRLVDFYIHLGRFFMIPWKRTLAKRSGDQPWDNPTKLQLILDILTGICALHNANLFDGHVNPDDICLYLPADDPDQQGIIPGTKYRARIANSFADTLNVRFELFARVYSANYKAPEHDSLADANIVGPDYANAQKKCDVYSVCILIYEILTGQALFPPELGAAEVRRLSIDKDWHEKLKARMLASWSEDLQRVISRGLDIDPSKRPPIQEILKYFRINGLNGIDCNTVPEPPHA